MLHNYNLNTSLISIRAEEFQRCCLQWCRANLYSQPCIAVHPGIANFWGYWFQFNSTKNPSQNLFIKSYKLPQSFLLSLPACYKINAEKIIIFLIPPGILYPGYILILLYSSEISLSLILQKVFDSVPIKCFSCQFWCLPSQYFSHAFSHIQTLTHRQTYWTRADGLEVLLHSTILMCTMQ